MSIKILGARKRFYIPPLIVICIAFLIAKISPNIEVDRVYRVCPVFICFVDTNIYGGDLFAGTCKGPVILINKKYRNDEEIRAHELVHSEQAYRTFFLHWIICYLFSDCLAEAEDEAYGRTGMTRESDADFYAKFVKKEYASETNVKFIAKKLRHYWKINN